MSEYVEPTFVILGRDIADAQDHYRHLVATWPEHIFGHRVRIVGCYGGAKSLRGLRVHDYAITERAFSHRSFDQAFEALKVCVAATTKNGDK